MPKKDKNDDLCTELRLLKVAIKQFALYGFEKTTTRSIVAEANANLSAISFHYDNKEKLYLAVLEYIVESNKQYHAKMFAEIDAVQNQGLLTPDMAWNYIDAIIDTVIDWNLDPENYYKSLLIKREAIFPSPAFKSVSSSFIVMYRYLERLYMVCTGTDDSFWAANTAYFSMGSIFAYSNFPELMETVMQKDMKDLGIAAAVKSSLKNNVITSVKAIIQNKKDSLVKL